MTLLADSGSTTTSWTCLESDAVMTTQGLNPHFSTDDQIRAALQAVVATLGRPDRLFFYGAGCGLPGQQRRLADLFAPFCPQVHVEGDLLGACRSLLGNRAGYAAILGTGSNCCFYDGHRVARQAVSTGFILGDHGSANHVGRLLLQDYLTGRMPHDIAAAFRDTFPLTTAKWLDRVYHQPQANRFLASLAPFATAHSDSDYCDSLLNQSLDAWLHHQLLPILDPGLDGNLGFVGSFAAAVSDRLRRLAASLGLTVSTIAADPLPGLRRYHQQS